MNKLRCSLALSLICLKLAGPMLAQTDPICGVPAPLATERPRVIGLREEGGTIRFEFERTGPAPWDVQTSSDLKSWQSASPTGFNLVGSRVTMRQSLAAGARFFRVALNGEPITARRSGVWSESGVWAGAVPRAGAQVVIPAGLDVTLDVDPPPLASLSVEGTLRLARRDTALTADWIMVHGRFEVGTAAQPFAQRATITLTGADTNQNITCSGMSMGAKFINVMNGGELAIHGAPATSWSRLADDARPGSRQITVTAADGWAVGDQIVIASRTIDPDQAEVRTLTAVNGNTLAFEAPLRFPHDGRVQTHDGRTVDLRAEVGRLTRRIVIQGDEDSAAAGNFGGHVMVMATGSAHVQGVEFRRMGQFDRLGRYPFHWHLVGEAPGQYIRNCSVNGSFQRGIVVHSTQLARVEDNVVFNSVGHNFTVEDEFTTNNVFTGNLAIANRIGLHGNEALLAQSDNSPAGFWIKSARNTFTYNSAAGSTGSGFWYDGVTDAPTVFHHNTMHSSAGKGVGMDFKRESGLLVVSWGDAVLEFSDSTLYQNANGIWPGAIGPEAYRNFVLADHWHGPAVISDGVGGLASFDDCLFIGHTRPPQSDEGTFGDYLPAALFLQYGHIARVNRPVFVNYGDNGVLSANDIFMEWQADFILSGVRRINTSASSMVTHESVILQLLDDSYGPAGVYVDAGSPQLGGRVRTASTIAGQSVLRIERRFGYARMAVRAEGTEFFDEGFFIRRSDGLRYQDRNGFRIIHDGGFAYRLESLPTAAEFSVHLDLHAPPTGPGTPAVPVTLPLDAAPRGVYRPESNTEDYAEEPITEAVRLGAATTLAEFEADPLNRYYYDSAARELHVQVAERKVLIRR